MAHLSPKTLRLHCSAENLTNLFGDDFTTKEPRQLACHGSLRTLRLDCGMGSCAEATPQQHASLEGLSALAALERLHLSNCAWIGYALPQLNDAVAAMPKLRGLVSGVLLVLARCTCDTGVCRCGASASACVPHRAAGSFTGVAFAVAQQNVSLARPLMLWSNLNRVADLDRHVGFWFLTGPGGLPAEGPGGCAGAFPHHVPKPTSQPPVRPQHRGAAWRYGTTAGS